MSHFRIRRSNVWRVLIWKCYWGNFANWAKVSSQYLTWFGFVSRGAHCTLYGLKKIINQKIYDALRDFVLFVQVKNVKNTHERVLLFVKLQAKNNTPSWVFFTFFQFNKWYQIVQSVSCRQLLNFCRL